MSRQDVYFNVEDSEKGKVSVRIIDRITPDDILLHLVEREFFKLAGGDDPGGDIPNEFRDFIVRSGALTPTITG